MYMKGYIKIIVILFCFVTPLTFVTSSNAGILFYDGFEKGLSLEDSWGVGTEGNPGSIELSTRYARDGSQSVKFSLNWESLQRSRSELRFRAHVLDGDNNFVIGKTYWIGWSTLVESGSISDRWVISTQWHDSPDECGSCGNPVFVFFNHSGGWNYANKWTADRCCTLGPDGSAEGELMSGNTPGQWVDWVVKWKPSYGDDGILQVWRNGTPVVNRINAPNCFNDEVGPYLKIGIYAYNWGEKEPEVKNIAIFYDEVRIGDQNSSYKEVLPGGGAGRFPTTILRIKR
jgi:hypothetical protein